MGEGNPITDSLATDRALSCKLCNLEPNHTPIICTTTEPVFDAVDCQSATITNPRPRHVEEEVVSADCHGIPSKHHVRHLLIPTPNFLSNCNGLVCETRVILFILLAVIVLRLWCDDGLHEENVAIRKDRK